MESKKGKTEYIPDAFDKGFIKALTMLQSMGRVRNNSRLERHLKMPPNTIYKVKGGFAGVPKRHRDNILLYFMQYHDINPKIFSSLDANTFQHDPPLLSKEEGFSHKVSGGRATAGDILRLQQLEAELDHTKKENELLRKLVKTLENQLNKSGSK